ncbi:hypothetical protein GOP47_0022295 [Adiantum capillus-veneris]|uniref:Uncharacterized protein n=1 Tax=Adiantum capillus-veneris TaxID=13818 RepID=A0A9D4U942_ADICA|nr:hypothetical protein GOP47_0022295 [Adiantum capillus-veneris]
MHAVTMGKKRVMVGAINTILILLLLQFMKQCSSSSSHDDDGDAFADDTLSRRNDTVESAPRHWPRRMLGSQEPASNKTSYGIPDHKHKVTHKSPMDGSRASSSNTINVPEEKDPGDRLQAQDCSSSSRVHCANNGTSGIDPRYGVEKRLVPTGPNPLHN